MRVRKMALLHLSYCSMRFLVLIVFKYIFNLGFNQEENLCLDMFYLAIIKYHREFNII